MGDVQPRNNDQHRITNMNMKKVKATDLRADALNNSNHRNGNFQSGFLSLKGILHMRFSLVMVILLLQCSFSIAQNSEEVIDRLIAIVGDEIILESEVYQNAQTLALQQGQSAMRDPAKLQKLKEDVLQEMINQKVLLAKAREDSIVVEQREVDRKLENRLHQIIQNVGSEEKLEELYGYSIRQIRRDFRSIVEENLMVERVKYQYIQDIYITRAEIEQYFQEHAEAFPPMKDAIEIAHILRETGSSGAADARALARADSIYNAIKSGESFDSLATALSDDPNTAEKQGHIGWTQRGDLLSSYEDAAFALKVGEVSRPVRTRYGYHIIRLDDRREEKISTSHILIIPKETEEDEEPVYTMLLSLRDEILTGRSFEETAKELSQDLESNTNSGYLGWFSLEEMPEEFKNNLRELQVDEISQPFKTQYGYHIVKIINRREARHIAMDQDWELISQRAQADKREEAYLKWIEELKERYYIEVKGEEQ